ncbi:unnamed protein product [Prunus armeniaca]|uniref:Uncharacterized protein n=1 Tax=Prunus armeniaca TaxID=36596 RepID=A0A6J5YEU0_PRUAR|nr:unnamed protein product [Prunus armeniaca]CAB4322068.1 unnamed protein product [Prunus armeniaca]
MFGGILFCLLGGASVTGQFMLQLYVNRLPSKDSSALFSRAQYALFTEFKGSEPLLKSDNRLMVAFRGNSYIIHVFLGAIHLATPASSSCQCS